MNETFQFKRFRTYFLYDLKQMWRNHSRPAILIGCSSVIFYIAWVLCSLVFAQSWSSPPIMARFAVLLVAFTILQLYQTRTYGYLTEKKAGSAWLMIPASGLEKFVSMILITLVIIPLLFFVVYYLLDGFLSLVDPTFGQALLSGTREAGEKMLNALTDVNDQSPILFTPGALVLPILINYCLNFLYFLLCGICFKKYKIVGAFAIMFGISLLMSILMGAFVPQMAESMDWHNVAEEEGWQLIARIMNGFDVFLTLVTIGLGWGIYHRIKTLKH